MAIHKLAEGPITLTVMSVELSEGNYGPQYRFTGEDGTAVFVSESSATKQLGRIGLTVESVVGKTIFLEQVQKNGTRYTNIALSTPGAAAARPAASAPAAAAAPAPRRSVEELAAIYQQCVDQAMITIGNRLMDSATPFDGAVIQSAAATLFIAATR